MARSEKFLHPMKTPERRAAEQFLSRAAQTRQYRPGALVVVERSPLDGRARYAPVVMPPVSVKQRPALADIVKPAMQPADRVMPVRIRGKREQAILSCGRWLDPAPRLAAR